MPEPKHSNEVEAERRGYGLPLDKRHPFYRWTFLMMGGVSIVGARAVGAGPGASRRIS
jgi:hypothetical protein